MAITKTDWASSSILYILFLNLQASSFLSMIGKIFIWAKTDELLIGVSFCTNKIPKYPTQIISELDQTQT